MSLRKKTRSDPHWSIVIATSIRAREDPSHTRTKFACVFVIAVHAMTSAACATCGSHRGWSSTLHMDAVSESLRGKSTRETSRKTSAAKLCTGMRNGRLSLAAGWWAAKSAASMLRRAVAVPSGSRGKPVPSPVSGAQEQDVQGREKDVDDDVSKGGREEAV